MKKTAASSQQIIYISIKVGIVIFAILGFVKFFTWGVQQVPYTGVFFFNADAFLYGHETKNFSGFMMNYPHTWTLTTSINGVTHEKDYAVCVKNRCLHIETSAPVIQASTDSDVTTTTYGGRGIDEMPATEVLQVNTKTGDVLTDQFLITNPIGNKNRVFDVTGTNINDPVDYRGYLISLLSNLTFMHV